MSDGDEPSTGSHFARDLEIIHYRVMREGCNVVGPIGSSRSVSDGDDPSTGSHFARDLEKIHYKGHEGGLKCRRTDRIESIRVGW